MGNQNGSSVGTSVPAGGALVANLPPASVGVGDLAQDNVVANLPPASAGVGDNDYMQSSHSDNRNFHGSDEKPPAEVSVKPDFLAVSRILDSIIPLKPFFRQKSSETSRSSFKGASKTKNTVDNDSRFYVECSAKIVVEGFLRSLGIKLSNKTTTHAGFVRDTSAFFKDDSSSKSKSKSKSKESESSTSPVSQHAQTVDDIIASIFGTEKTSVSLFFQSPETKFISEDTIQKINYFLRKMTLESFINIFETSGGKPSERHQKSLVFFRYLLSQYHLHQKEKWQDWRENRLKDPRLTHADSNPEETNRILSYILHQSKGQPSQCVSIDQYPAETKALWSFIFNQAKQDMRVKLFSPQTLDEQFLAKFEFFFSIMSAQNQKCLFESYKTRGFLYDLAIELLRKLGRDTKKISFDDVSSSHAAIVVLIFKGLYQQFDELEETDVPFQQMLVQLFRTMTECFSANNGFLIERFCFGVPSDLSQFRLRMTALSTGLSHNSLLDCNLSGLMLDPVKVWNQICEKSGLFAWTSETGSGKSTLLLLLAILQALISNANVVYVGPETATMNPAYIATIIEVACQFMESCGRARPVVRLNQSGVVAKCESKVVNVFMTRVAGHCLPLLHTVFKDTPSIVAIDDNTRLSPAQLKSLFSKFNVSQLHICGTTMDFTGCGNVVRIGEEVATTVSFCAPTFIDQNGIVQLSPDMYRQFLLLTKSLREKSRKLFQYFNVSGGFISFFNTNPAILAKFHDIVASFAKVKTVLFVELVRLARLLHTGFPAFQTGKVYSLEELTKITLLVRKFITITTRIGFVFDDERLQFPKDLSEAEQIEECRNLVNQIRDGEAASIVLTSANNAYDIEECLVKHSQHFNSPIFSSTKDGLWNPTDEREPTEGGELSESSSEDDDPQSEDEDDGKKSGRNRSSTSMTKPTKKATKKPAKKPAKKPVSNPAQPPPNSSQIMADHHSIQSAELDAKRDAERDAADVAAVAAVAAAVAAAAPAAPADADAVPSDGRVKLSADDACFAAGGGSPDWVPSSSSSTSTDDSRLTLKQILNKIVKSTALVGHRSLPQRKDVHEALSILCKSEHPDSSRWLKSFIYGVFLPDTIMPTQFIELCLEMFNQGRIIMVLAYELFHLQSWNSKCGLRMKIVVATAVPLWVLRQTMARAGRLGTEHSGEITSWVSCIVLPTSDVSVCESVSDIQMPLMQENGCPIERAIMEMLNSGNFSEKHHAFIQEFLRLFYFAYRNPVCEYTCKGGRDYFMDFMKFLSGVLVSKFVDKFNCEFTDPEESLKLLAFTKFRHGTIVDQEQIMDEFAEEMLRLVGSESASMSLCLARATGPARAFVGISRFDLPHLFKQLYEEYPDSMTSFLNLIRNLLLNLQTMPLCKRNRDINTTVSAMLLVITSTIDFVGDILHLLADILRELDMDQFRVGFVPTLRPIEKLRILFNSKAGLPTLQDFGAFLGSHRHDLPILSSNFDDVCAFLSSTPSGRFHDMKQRSQVLNTEIAEKLKEKQSLEISKGKPQKMHTKDWIKHIRTEEYKAFCKKVDDQLLALSAEISKLKDELALIEKQLANLPTQLSEVVRYFKKLI